MQTLTIDPLAEIGKKFSNPLDIVAFELSSVQAKRAVEKYNLYREWEKHYMPKDDLRMIAIELVQQTDHMHFWTADKRAIAATIYKVGVDGRVEITVDARQKLPFVFSKKYPYDSNSKNSHYDLFFDIYNLLDSGLQVSTARSHRFADLCVQLFGTTRTSGFKILEDFKYPNEKYRILSLYVSYLPDKNRKIMFRKQDEIINSMQAYDRFRFAASSRFDMIYYLLEKGWTVRVTDEEDRFRIVRNCLVCHLETKLVENNNSNRSFCGTECQARFYEK